MAPIIVLITGGNRGLGKGLLELYLAKPNQTVIAANRDPEDATSKALLELPEAEGSSLLLVKIDSTVPTDAAEAMKHLAFRGIDHLDIVIANSGIVYVFPTISSVKIEDMRVHTETNTYGVVRLYQATLPLLKKSKKPIWVSMGSSAGLITVSDLNH
jgi:NAD(P)-dependent dehydrogenase (short-subunit alcohol dehydrogenase family)